MKLKDLFDIILKVFGLFLAKDILATLPYLISPILELLNSETREGGITTLILTLGILAFYFLITYLLLFRTTTFVNFLKLEPEFLDDRLTFNVSSKNVVTISLIILSGYILIDQIPNFFNYIFTYYQQSRMRFAETKPPVSNIIVAAIKILIAFLIIGERKKIINLIIKDEIIPENDK